MCYADWTLGDNGKATITISFVYTPGGNNINLSSRDIGDELSIGELRERVEHARSITKEQKVILDKIKGLHRFFEQLDLVCNSVKEVSNLTSLCLIIGPNSCCRSIGTLNQDVMHFYCYTG